MTIANYPIRRAHLRFDTRERKIIEDRFGLIRGQEPLTLKQIGASMGISKERVRQIQTRTIGKLREAAEEGRLNLDMVVAEPSSNPPGRRSLVGQGHRGGGAEYDRVILATGK